MNISHRLLIAGLAIAAGLAQAQVQSQVQTKSGLSLYYWTYPTATPGITLPGQLPAGQGQSGLAVAVQSGDSTVTEFVVTVNYTAPDGSTQTAVHKFTAASSGYTTELFPVGVVQAVTRVSVIPVIAEVVFTSVSGSDDGSVTAARRTAITRPQ